MFSSRHQGALATALVVLAVGFASPAYATDPVDPIYSITANQTSIGPSQSVSFTTDAPSDKIFAFLSTAESTIVAGNLVGATRIWWPFFHLVGDRLHPV
jgi:hypothetical protein